MLSRTITQTADSTPVDSYPNLQSAINLIGNNATRSSLLSRLNNHIASDDLDLLITLYHETITHFEAQLWSNNPHQDLLQIYQGLFLELEEQLTLQTTDSRHHIVIVIPVADRPRQLTDCINSLVAQCDNYGYGGYSGKYYNKISLIIADDSTDKVNIQKNRTLCNQTDNRGLKTTYFGNEEQNALISSYSDKQQDLLSRQTGNPHIRKSNNKGPSVMRNLSYLFLNEQYSDSDNVIFYFIDSDQLFTVNQNSANTQEINYFYYLDRIFKETKTRILTGKVVGDPPVSPAVMANTLLDDCLSFISEVTRVNTNDPCQFHEHDSATSEQGSYHDMADLFGYSTDHNTYKYTCPLTGKHNNNDCLINFFRHLNQFFYGEHPTRSTSYQYSNPLDGLLPARTVYTGNYAFKPESLQDFIPFSSLHLRMAGPTLGRLLKQSLGDRFISTNLPMLHKRILSNTGISEFRAGIDHSEDIIDLHQEFKRQYYGDIMLFSIDRLTETGFPDQIPDRETVEGIVNETEKRLNHRYRDRQKLIMEKIDSMKSLIEAMDIHTIAPTELDQITQSSGTFFNAMLFNYGKDSAFFTELNKGFDNDMYEGIISSIMNYPEDVKNWKKVLSGKI